MNTRINTLLGGKISVVHIEAALELAGTDPALFSEAHRAIAEGFRRRMEMFDGLIANSRSQQNADIFQTHRTRIEQILRKLEQHKTVDAVWDRSWGITIPGTAQDNEPRVRNSWKAKIE